MSKKSGYVIHDFDNGKYGVCKIIDETRNLDEAEQLLLKLLSESVDEDEIIKKYLKKIRATFQ